MEKLMSSNTTHKLNPKNKVDTEIKYIDKKR